MTRALQRVVLTTLYALLVVWAMLYGIPSNFARRGPSNCTSSRRSRTLRDDLRELAIRRSERK
jgi:hypothetical protein